MHQDSTTIKIPGWQTRLLTTVNSLKEVSFQWGQNDCCIFAAKCIDAQYGTKIADEVVGQYDSEISCKRFMLKRVKDTSLAMVLDSFLPVRVDRKFAQRGDVVTFNGDLGLTAGVLWTGCIWAMGPNGVVTFKLTDVEITDAWRV